MEPAVLVSKTGCVFYSRDAVVSYAGEVGGQSEGAMRALVRAGFRVVYFGRWDGSFVPGIEVVEPHIDGLKASSPPELQEELWELDAASLEQHAPFGFALHFSGPPHSQSTIANPQRAKVIDAAVRYQGPALYALHRFKLRRAVALVDPLQRPRDQEMSQRWPEARPVALIGQGNDRRISIVGRKQYAVETVYGACETWNYDVPSFSEKRAPAVCVAHAHLDRVPQTTWIDLLGNPPDGFRVYGSGWRDFIAWNSETFPGPLPAPSAFDQLRYACCCPVLAHTENWFGTKQWLCLSNGCIPLSYGRTGHEPCCWDPEQKHLPLDHWSRVLKPGDVKSISERMFHDQSWFELRLCEMKERFKPNFSVLLDMASAMMEGKTSGWGGYMPC